MSQLKRYLIERDVPGIGGMSIVELCGAGVQPRHRTGRGRRAMATQLRGGRQDFLHLPRRQRGHDPQTRRVERHPGHADH